MTNGVGARAPAARPGSSASIPAGASTVVIPGRSRKIRPQPGEAGPRARRAAAGAPEQLKVGGVTADVVNRATDEVGDQDADSHRGRGEEERHHDAAAVRTEKAEQAPERPHSRSTLEVLFRFAGAPRGKENTQVMGRSPAPI